MSNNGRLTIIFLSHLLLYFLIGELNFFLGSYSLYFHGDALLVVFFGLFLKRLGGLVCVILLAFLAESANPVPYGTYIIGYLFLWLFFVWGRRRIRPENPSHVRTLAAIAQLLWMVVLSLLMLAQGTMLTVSWERMLTEIFLSTAIVFLLVSYWCLIQKHLLYKLGWNLEAEMSKI